MLFPILPSVSWAVMCAQPDPQLLRPLRPYWELLNKISWDGASLEEAQSKQGGCINGWVLEQGKGLLWGPALCQVGTGTTSSLGKAVGMVLHIPAKPFSPPPDFFLSSCAPRAAQKHLRCKPWQRAPSSGHWEASGIPTAAAGCSLGSGGTQASEQHGRTQGRALESS